MAPDLLTPPAQGDDGRADSTLLSALRSGDRAALTAALPGARVFVGVEARALATDALTGADKQSDMVLVTLRTPSGSGALPVFSAVDVMAAWRPSVRPVAVTLPDACAEAVRMGLAAVVIDLGGPAPVTLDVRPAAGDGSDGTGCRIPRPFGRGEGMWISSSSSSTGRAGEGSGHTHGDGVPGMVALPGAGGPDEVIVADDTGGGLLRPRPVPLGARGRRRIRAALAGLPAGTEVWPAELAPPAGRDQVARPVLAVAVAGLPGSGGPGATSASGQAAATASGTVPEGASRTEPDGAMDGVDEMTAQIVRRLRRVIEDPAGRVAGGADAGPAVDEVEAAVLVVDPTEVPAVRAHLGRGVRPPRRFTRWRLGPRG